MKKSIEECEKHNIKHCMCNITDAEGIFKTWTFEEYQKSLVLQNPHSTTGMKLKPIEIVINLKKLQAKNIRKYQQDIFQNFFLRTGTS